MTPFFTTATIFLAALLIISIIAWVKFNVPFWAYVDYPWVLATLVSVLIAISGNTTTRNFDDVKLARQAFRTSISEVLFSMDGIIDRYCETNALGALPNLGELYRCPRMRHMRYQASGDFRMELIRDVDSQDLPQNWSTDFCASAPIPGPEHAGLTTETGPFCGPMHDFEKAQKQITASLAKYESDKSFLDRAAKDGRLRYWYYFYAVLAALRLSRITADIRRLRRPVSIVDEIT